MEGLVNSPWNRSLRRQTVRLVPEDQPTVARAIGTGKASSQRYGVDFDGDGRIDLPHSVPDVLASTANLLHTNGWQAGQPYREGTANFEAMREWNHSEIYRKTLVLFAERLGGRP